MIIHLHTLSKQLNRLTDHTNITLICVDVDNVPFRNENEKILLLFIFILMEHKYKNIARCFRLTTDSLF